MAGAKSIFWVKFCPMDVPRILQISGKKWMRNITIFIPKDREKNSLSAPY
jgi:hypothetical protein